MDLTHARHPRRSAVALIGAVALLSACGGGDGGESSSTASTASTTSAASPSSQSASSSGGEASSSSAPAAEKVVITISDFAFSVPESVPAGAEISVTNNDSIGHTVTADSGDAFDVNVAPGATVTFAAPEKPGTYAFHCKPHPNMTSSLVVK
ncbi:cupredoxin domain-containing protein [Janibacter sp. Soil728]|uniref:cupredoxin domain-containing protein n=1 Tax=Janibacter sp. Soil728 TaxID=1736393 RepID=UPI0009E8F177|nr:cupredoxin domain-containing protein [Janibacter sp. Soil728]